MNFRKKIFNFHDYFKKNDFQTIIPKKTPRIVKIIIILISFFSLLSSILILVRPNFFFTFSLSIPGMQKKFFWQILTNFFIVPRPFVSFRYVIHTIFVLYLFWVFSIEIINFKGKKHYIFLLLTCSILSSMVALLFLNVFSFQFFNGADTLIYFLAISWLMLNRDAKFFILFTSIKAKWVIFSIMILNLLSSLSLEYYVYFATNISAIIIGYLYSLIVWKVNGPFNFLRKFEDAIIKIIKKHH
ncbi:MAG: hypothetical protein AMS24_02020 [Chlamydiae bacterium SM23_39]|nr:MAG: hypothetical protein AMS24_02020 [Chlamydiae bacterium SM23_39]